MDKSAAMEQLEAVLTRGGASEEEIELAKNQAVIMMDEMLANMEYERNFTPHPHQKEMLEIGAHIKMSGFVFAGWKVFLLSNDPTKATKIVAEWIPEPEPQEEKNDG